MAFRLAGIWNWRLRLRLEGAARKDKTRSGKARPFRTSGGSAAVLYFTTVISRVVEL